MVWTRTAVTREREILVRRRRRLRRALRKARESYPATMRINQKGLLRWIVRITDMRTPVGRSWAKKALGTTRRSLPARFGDPRSRDDE